MHVVIFSGGSLRPGRFTKQALATADLVIAADSGGRTALEFGVTPAVVLGDFDSLDQKSHTALEQVGCQFIRHDPAKDQTDTELAIAYAVAQQASRITILGGTEGDRLDHILANVFLLLNEVTPVTLANGPMQAWLAKGPATVPLDGRKEDLLSLLPLSPEVTDVQTTHLCYPLHAETLYQHQARGISNVLTGPKASVTFEKGSLLFVQTAAD